jgi:predicted KAP-like P-loop ATPase
MWADNVTDKDFLGFDVHADLIKELLEDDSMLPITIGLFGDWGSGKSSILEILKTKLESPEKGVACLYFNGWVFEGYDDAKAALLESIVKEFEDTKRFGDKISDNIKDLVKSVNWMRVAGYGMRNIAIPAVSAYLTGGLSLIAQGLKTATAKPEELLNKLKGEEGEAFINQFIKESKLDNKTQSVREFRDNFETMIEKSKINKLIILIDDLDRCTPERIIDNLEAIKLFLNVKNTAFIIGADERIVRHAIETRYKSSGLSNEIGKYENIVTDYLEKLIQIPYRLPRLSNSDVQTYMTLLFCKRDLKAEEFQVIYEEFIKFRATDKHTAFSDDKIIPLLSKKEYKKELAVVNQIAPLVTEGLKGNPRQIKRFLNTFTLRLKLASVANFKLKNEVLAKLMVLEYTHLERFKDLCTWQQLQNGFPKQIQELEQHCNNASKLKALNELKIWTEDIFLMKWIAMEPTLSKEDLRDYIWISRDKLIETIDASSMVPVFVRAVFESLSNFTTKADLKKQISEKVNTQLSDSEKTILFELIKKQIIENPDDDKIFEVAYAMYYENVTRFTSYLLEALNSTDLSLVSPASAVDLVKISKTLTDLNSILSKVPSDCRLSKAIKQQTKTK